METSNLKEKDEINSLIKRQEELCNMRPDDVSSFKILPLSKKTFRGLCESNFLEPTKVQRATLCHSLRSTDIVAAAKTGSGKTLAFVIPVLEALFVKKWTLYDGMGGLIITPTRELAYQIFEVFRSVGKYHDFSIGLVIGGKDLNYEWNRISKCNILICTPGRLLQHMTQNAEFSCDNVQLVVLDEADHSLSLGFADTMNCILEELPKERQTLLFSATQTREVKDLVRAGCRNPVFCSVHENSKTVTPEGLHEYYVIVDNHDKINFIWSFARHHRKKKIMVFLATCKQVKYMYDIFCKLHPGLSVMCLHGSMHQLRRMAIYDEFCKKRIALLFTTDVAARGLDIPKVDWVIQLDCPEDTNTYIHRVGRTARYDRAGDALLVLTPYQEHIVSQLRQNNISIESISVAPKSIECVRVKIECILSKYTNLKEEAQRAFRTYIKHVMLMKDKKAFNIDSIDLDAYARSLGLVVIPRLRFLKNTPSTVPKCISENEPPKTLNFNFDDDDKDFLVSKKYADKNQDSDSEEEKQFPVLNTEKQKVKKQSKYKQAKKLLKKGIKLNIVAHFDEEGNIIQDPFKKQVKASSSEIKSEGISIDDLKRVMAEEDKIDKIISKNLRKEKKRLLKTKADMDDNSEESISSEDETNETKEMSNSLPDPDKIYGEQIDSNNSSDESLSADGLHEQKDNSKEFIEKKRKISARKKSKEKLKLTKKVRLMQENTLDAIPEDEKEKLALYLLQK